VSHDVLCLGGDITLTFTGQPPFGVYYTVDDKKTETFVVTGGNDTTIVADIAGLYTFKNMFNGNICSSCEFSIQVYPKVISGTIGKDTTICYNTAPAQLKLITPVSDDSNLKYRWIQSKDNGENWESAGSDVTTFSPQKLTVTTLYRLITTDESKTNQCQIDTSNTVKITVRSQQLTDYPDIRIHVCPNIDTFKLSKYLDTLEVTSILWTGFIPIVDPAGAGKISSNDFGNLRSLTLMYTISNVCVSNISRKVYLNILGNGKMPPRLRNEITICYEQAESLNINQIFGIEAGGILLPSPQSNEANLHIKESSYGAVIMNGKAFYEAGNQEVEFIYTSSDNCFGGEKEFKFVIKLVGNN
jgi:hypothetical protein